MAAPTIIGTTVIIGFPTGETVTGVIRDTYEKQTTADIEQIRDENNNEVTGLVSNAGLRIIVDGKCTSDPSLSKGSSVTINSVKYLIEDARMRHVPGVTRFSLTCYKPSALTIA